jgi:RNA polymerase sigma-70 factor (ECF subfamily)
MIDQQSDEDLIKAYRAQSMDWARLFRLLIQRHQEALFQYLWRKTGSSHDAEDLVQESFIRAYQKIDLYNEAYSFRSWLYTIATRLCINSLKKHKPTLDNTMQDTLVDKQETPPDLDLLWQKAKKLPEDQYSVLLLKYSEELSLKEISQVLSKPVNTIKVLLHRARHTLSKTLNPDDLFVH